MTSNSTLTLEDFRVMAASLERDQPNAAFYMREAIRKIQSLSPSLPSPSEGEMPSFVEAWAKKEAEGYIYGEEALERVEFGYEIAKAEIRPHIDRLEARVAELEDYVEQRRAEIKALRLKLHRRRARSLIGESQ